MVNSGIFRKNVWDMDVMEIYPDPTDNGSDAARGDIHGDCDATNQCRRLNRREGAMYVGFPSQGSLGLDPAQCATIYPPARNAQTSPLGSPGTETQSSSTMTGPTKRRTPHDVPQVIENAAKGKRGPAPRTA